MTANANKRKHVKKTKWL